MSERVKPSSTVYTRHDSFRSRPGEALRRFVVDDGVGKDGKILGLSQRALGTLSGVH